MTPEFSRPVRIDSIGEAGRTIAVEADAGERAALVRRVVDEALGLGVLEPLLADETVTEIMVNGPDHVFVEREGRVERVDTAFASEDQLYQTIDRIVAQVNRRVDESSPMVDARLPGGERVNVIIPPLSLVGPVLTIRYSSPMPDVIRVQVSHYAGGERRGPEFPLQDGADAPVSVRVDGKSSASLTSGGLSVRVASGDADWKVEFVTAEGRVVTRSGHRGLGYVEVGSTSGAAETAARASAIRRRCPPDSRAAPSPTGVS